MCFETFSLNSISLHRTLEFYEKSSFYLVSEITLLYILPCHFTIHKLVRLKAFSWLARRSLSVFDQQRRT